MEWEKIIFSNFPKTKRGKQLGQLEQGKDTVLTVYLVFIIGHFFVLHKFFQAKKNIFQKIFFFLQFFFQDLIMRQDHKCEKDMNTKKGGCFGSF